LSTGPKRSLFRFEADEFEPLDHQRLNIHRPWD